MDGGIEIDGIGVFPSLSPVEPRRACHDQENEEKLEEKDAAGTDDPYVEHGHRTHTSSKQVARAAGVMTLFLVQQQGTLDRNGTPDPFETNREMALPMVHLMGPCRDFWSEIAPLRW